MTPFEHQITAQPDDIDELGHVNNAVWVTWIQAVATAHWEAVAPPEDVALYAWVVVRHEIDYRGNVTAGETVTARTWADPGGPRGARFDRLMEFVGSDGKVKVAARSTWAMISRADGRIQRITPEIAAPFLGSV